MTIKEAYRWAIGRLAELPNAALDARVLLGHVLNIPPSQVLVDLLNEINEGQFKRFEGLVERRAQHEPIAYIVEHKEFMGFDVIVNQNALVPRPESESIVLKTIDLIKEHRLKTVYDLGTGTGALALAIAKAMPEVKIIASDISSKALKVAKRNVEKYGLSEQIELVCSDLDNHVEHAELAIANLPYLPDNFEGNEDLKFEPSVALFASEYGLSFYHKLFEHNKFDRYVIELGSIQAPILAEWLEKQGGFKFGYVYDPAESICGMWVEGV